MKSISVFVLAISFFLVSGGHAHAFGKKPVSPPSPPPGSGEQCPAPGAVQAVDLSMPVDQPFLDVMKSLQINTVIRYYDQPDETIAGKTLTPGEVDLLARNGFDVMVVFQHNNNRISTFTSARGVSDAKRSLSLASTDGQSKGSAIYFGVDGDWSSASDLSAIQTYFGQAAPLVRAGGFKVGVYGSGLVCQRLLSKGLADFCWLANATSWPGYHGAIQSRVWALKQGLPQDCGGKNVDFDVLNAQVRDPGQFRP